MATKKRTTPSRHGKLAEGTAQTSITMRKDLLDKAKAAAEADGRSLSNWLQEVVKKSLGLIVLAFLALHVTRSPRHWNAAALAATGKAAVQKLQHLAK